MTAIVTSTGTYNWFYSVMGIPYGGNHAVVDPTTLNYMRFIGDISQSGQSSMNSITDAINYIEGSFSGASFDMESGLDPSTSAGYFFITTGATYDSGTVQIYAYRHVSAINPSTNTVSEVWYWIWYAPTGSAPSIPPVTPTPVILQLGKNNSNTYLPKSGQEDILAKYKSGVQMIRAKFQTTRIAVIRDNNLGGFIIYEEIAGNPSGDCYVYNSDRTLKDIVQPSGLNQYIL